MSSQIRAAPCHSPAAAARSSSQPSRRSERRDRHRAKPARKSPDRRRWKILQHVRRRRHPPSRGIMHHAAQQVVVFIFLGRRNARFPGRGRRNRVSFMPSGANTCFAAYSSSDSPDNCSTSAPSTTKLISLYRNDDPGDRSGATAKAMRYAVSSLPTSLRDRDLPAGRSSAQATDGS